MRQQPDLRDSFGLLQRYHLERLMTPGSFSTQSGDGLLSVHDYSGPQSPTAIHFSIDGRQETWSHSIERTFGDSFLLRKELPSGMLLVDVLLRSNIFPLQHLLQRRGPILDALFRISKGFYFGPHHLIMAALRYFEEKVHRKKLQRADMIPLLFPRLLCHILEHMSYPTEPHLERPPLSRAFHSRPMDTVGRPPLLILLYTPVPPAAPPTLEDFITYLAQSFIQQHLGLPPPQTDIPGPSEPIAPAEETIRANVRPQATHEAATEPSSPLENPAP
ncbi:hypothetical protein CK203_039889 [Vitis vinifera]|uniref:Uncharacterized protein n=1 Tax=Vitis vinifera TaxID=29760 RepID=A0A438I3C1_VITVI|nr:hypothetical protein CK203_039889 [Vitis vinifera]